MRNKHEQKFIINLLIGLVFTSAGILSIVYSNLTQQNEQDWLFWAVIPVITINIGLLLIGNAVVHKVKSDLIRRQKQKNGRPERMEE